MPRVTSLIGLIVVAALTVPPTTACSNTRDPAVVVASRIQTCVDEGLVEANIITFANHGRKSHHLTGQKKISPANDAVAEGARKPIGSIDLEIPAGGTRDYPFNVTQGTYIWLEIRDNTVGQIVHKQVHANQCVVTA